MNGMIFYPTCILRWDFCPVWESGQQVTCGFVLDTKEKDRKAKNGQREKKIKNELDKNQVQYCKRF